MDSFEPNKKKYIKYVRKIFITDECDIYVLNG